MPKEIHNKLVKQAKKLIKQGKLKKTNEDAYVYGTLNKIEYAKKNK